METPEKYTKTQNAARIGLGLLLMAAGTSHLTFARKEFQAQVPDWVPVKKDTTVLLSGVAEIALGASIIALKKKRVPVGLFAAGFFAAVFPGNIGFCIIQHYQFILRNFLYHINHFLRRTGVFGLIITEMRHHDIIIKSSQISF